MMQKILILVLVLGLKGTIMCGEAQTSQQLQHEVENKLMGKDWTCLPLLELQPDLEAMWCKHF